MIRKLVKIDEDKCNGCGQCVPSCHEGAIQLINGKAKLTAEKYCDGLGDCLGTCPVDAITVLERETSEDFNEEAVKIHLAGMGKKFIPRNELQNPEKIHSNNFAHASGSAHSHGNTACPSAATRSFKREPVEKHAATETAEQRSELTHWPVQLCLVSPSAPFLQNADLLISADCVPFAYAGFHQKFLKDKALLIGCPKLDDAGFYREKLTEIFRNCNVKKISLVHMEVPCCFGLEAIIKEALKESGKDIPLERVVVTLDGNLR